ncbi:35068_t:CDS:2, partial [Racocetra persica]
KKKDSGCVLPEESVLYSDGSIVFPDGKELPAECVVLPEGRDSVNNIFTQHVTQNLDILKHKEKLNPKERATVRYCMSKIIGLSTHMKEWFTIQDRQYIIKKCEPILIIPELGEEVDMFINNVEQ